MFHAYIDYPNCGADTITPNIDRRWAPGIPVMSMRKKGRRKSKRSETMQRNAAISSITPRMRLSVHGPDDAEPEIEGRPWLELRGTLVEPIRDVQDLVVKLWSDPDARIGPARPAALGYITGIRPAVEVIARCAPADFGYIWSLALSGHLTHVYMLFTKPHYSSASVLNLSFSNEAEE
jgi:hypothetical protein